MREPPLHEAEALLERKNVSPYSWADGYPLDDTLVATRWYVKQRCEGVWRKGFGVYQIVRRLDRMVIGDIGFHGAPSSSGKAEIGFGLAPMCRGQGFATESLMALAGWALQQTNVFSIIADPAIGNEKSIGVLMRSGFRFTGEDKDLRHYERKLWP